MCIKMSVAFVLLVFTAQVNASPLIERAKDAKASSSANGDKVELTVVEVVLPEIEVELSHPVLIGCQAFAPNMLQALPIEKPKFYKRWWLGLHRVVREVVTAINP